ncbi:MAG: sigma-70 family RNA polymerase sigma factor [Bacilli bacterium]|nr:sigma-70 family RNA polymerase sigma factor [Bacilli bacterium]
MNYKDLNDYELISKVTESEEATELLFKKYSPLIIRVAKKIYDDNSNYNHSGLELADLIQEGMIGFSTAINTYNEHKDTLFFTYAKKCIESKIITSIVGANRQKHSFLNSSISMEAIGEDEFSSRLDKFVGDINSDPELILIDIENVNGLVAELMGELTVFESQVFDLKKSGFTYREIAEVLDTEPKKIDNAIQRIKVKIKNYLNKHND